ncbi:MAG: hypothetical protein WC956_04165 [bacterium]
MKMSTENINTSSTTDILTIMRELDHKDEEKRIIKVSAEAAAPKDAEGISKANIDPSLLLDSLQKKRTLLNLIDGYAEVKGIDQIKHELNEAIEFLKTL